MTEPASHPFVKYVSAVTGHHVERYGTGTVIGGRRQPAPAGTGSLDRNAVSLEELLSQRGAGKLEIDESAIVTLTADEWAKHWQAYERALRKGALRERKPAEYWEKVDAEQRLADAVKALEAVAPGAAAKLAELTEDSIRAALDAVTAAEEGAAPVDLGGSAPPAGMLPAVAEPLRGLDEGMRAALPRLEDEHG